MCFDLPFETQFLFRCKFAPNTSFPLDDTPRIIQPIEKVLQYGGFAVAFDTEREFDDNLLTQYKKWLEPLLTSNGVNILPRRDPSNFGWLTV